MRKSTAMEMLALVFVLGCGSKEEAIGPVGGIPHFDFVYIEPGSFMMGSPAPGVGDEHPQHPVTISKGFYLSAYELTQGQWQQVMGSRPWAGRRRVKEDPEYPAVMISWELAQTFIQKLNETAGLESYRLPTEAEWEYACRAGTTTRWSFGGDESRVGAYAWTVENTYGAGEAYPHEVGTKQPNPWGLYDVHGNVGEWVQDWHSETYYLESPVVDPQGPETGDAHVYRGGVFHAQGYLSRSAARSRHGTGVGTDSVGIRLVKRSD